MHVPPFTVPPLHVCPPSGLPLKLTFLPLQLDLPVVLRRLQRLDWWPLIHWFYSLMSLLSFSSSSSCDRNSPPGGSEEVRGRWTPSPTAAVVKCQQWPSQTQDRNHYKEERLRERKHGNIIMFVRVSVKIPRINSHILLIDEYWSF